MMEVNVPFSTDQPGPPFLVIKDLVKDFESERVVDHVSLTINQGEIFALLGCSGCGKSTLLRMLAGLERPSAGEILLAGESLVDIPAYCRPVNMMFQSYALFPHLNVWNNIAFGLRREGMDRNRIAERVEQMLCLVQLQGFGERRIHQLSGGQQQRVALARSLAKRPQLLLLDEPLAALDKKLREQTQLELLRIIKQVGVTCMMVTHDQEEAMAMATRIAIMNQGTIVQTGEAAELYEAPNCGFVANFIGNVNVFHGKVVTDQTDQLLIVSPECRHCVRPGSSIASDQQVMVAIRPEKIQLSTAMSDSSPDQSVNRVAGELIEQIYLGSHTVYHLRLATGKVIRASVGNRTQRSTFRPVLGDRLIAGWEDDAMVVLTH